jgi:hypothetical protein
MKAAAKKATRVVRSRAGLEGSVEAKRAAAVILEGLSGLRSPAEASRTLGVSPPRYYALELRGLQGLIAAMEPRRRGRHRGPEQGLAEALRERDRLRRELSRAQALLRTAQRAMGIPSEADHRKARRKEPGEKSRRRRRPVVRAKKAVKVLRAAEEKSELARVSPTPIAEPRQPGGAA